MRSPVTLVFLVLLIVPASAGAQEAAESTAAAPTSQGAPAPVDAKARAPAKSRNFFGQAMAELTRSVEASRADPARLSRTDSSAPAKATNPAPTPTQAPATEVQVAAQEPTD